jgi:hypothetical protein
MIKSWFTIKLVKNFYNFLFSKKIPDTLKTTSFKLSKQTTFICSRCGAPFNPAQWLDVKLEQLGKLNNQHLIAGYFKVLKHTKFYRGTVYKPQIQYFESIKDRNNSLMACKSCNTTNYQNILILKLLDVNIALVL